MDFENVSVWDVVRRFLLGWAAAGLLLVIISCVRYGEFIRTALSENMGTWLAGIFPVAVIVLIFVLLARALFG